MDETIKKQFTQLKAKHPDALLLFRIESEHPATYDLYQEDAIYAAHILDLEVERPDTISAKLSFPHDSLDIYLPKLVRAGYRVAICEQLEDPKLSKKLVKRGISENFNR